ncbi:glutathione-dependent formaldehyde dehydrogenase [Gracilibacillus boraciitolerans JCM 21714]|uniref:Glutathione-dependent formaldehyde dehydrogenase n=1 Tax=Gracilibacillus boraciitolerans JCM 21714 TaxID=1298598 RepID=W4VKR8_9BACI|nr:glutathione-dependent formaldehyde dehydrogenase [Gracilibacillus boraciitolerans JCM 21714]
MGQAHARSFMEPLYQQIVHNEIDPTQIITHQLPLEEAAHGYTIFNEKEDNCIKVILQP